MIFYWHGPPLPGPAFATAARGRLIIATRLEPSGGEKGSIKN